MCKQNGRLKANHSDVGVNCEPVANKCFVNSEIQTTERWTELEQNLHAQTKKLQKASQIIKYVCISCNRKFQKEIKAFE